MNGAENPTDPGAAQADANASKSNRRDWECFDKRLTELRVNDVENIIARGQVLIEAHDELERGSYEATVKRHFDLSYVRKLRIIAAHPIMADRARVHALPSSVFTLYELTKLPGALLREKLKDGRAGARRRNRGGGCMSWVFSSTQSDTRVVGPRCVRSVFLIVSVSVSVIPPPNHLILLDCVAVLAATHGTPQR